MSCEWCLVMALSLSRMLRVSIGNVAATHAISRLGADIESSSRWASVLFWKIGLLSLGRMSAERAWIMFVLAMASQRAAS